jgi:hypothetical protein
MTPIFFVLSIILAYFIPFFLNWPGFLSWIAVEFVFLIDVVISNIKYSSGVSSTSKAMTNLGCWFAAGMGVFVIFFPRSTPFEFILYFVISAIVYTFWHHADTGEWLW